MGENGKVHQGTCMKDTWTKPKGVGLRAGGRDGWGCGGSMGVVTMETIILEQQFLKRSFCLPKVKQIFSYVFF